MKTDEFKSRLLAEEKRLTDRMGRAGTQAREPIREVSDEADASVDDVRKDAQFAVADADWVTLGQVRDALARIENGTFGRCEVDGGPIDEERLRALPWASTCARHAQLREAAAPPRTPSL
ncbi:MAG TPA: TraR/DksA C4-type zinc finger protein [Candidatus Polarisedimenticolia bacterium]|nr:TraR/DksA C4-type zinc finger protein [Candidatus Polarisedimenticolia bacterium]